MLEQFQRPSHIDKKSVLTRSALSIAFFLTVFLVTDAIDKAAGFGVGQIIFALVAVSGLLYAWKYFFGRLDEIGQRIELEAEAFAFRLVMCSILVAAFAVLLVPELRSYAGRYGFLTLTFLASFSVTLGRTLAKKKLA